MKPIYTCLLLTFAIFSNLWSGYSQEVPNTYISNGTIGCEIYLPDTENGYYRGTRFDWAGVVASLEYKGHTYFGKWFDKYEPTIHDAIMGPVEAFDPIGYNSAKPQESFVKIGVGILERPDSTDYHFSKSYKILNHGKWNIETKNEEVRFTHQITKGKYPYTYHKSIQLKDDKMIIEHTLVNDGDKNIESRVFNHNFFVIDQQKTGPGFSIQFPFGIEGDESRLGGFAEVVKGKKIKFVKELGENDHPMIVNLSGFSTSEDDYDIRVENSNTGAGVRITCDQPLSHMVFWSAIKTLSPEPYIDVNVKNGESFSWTISYEFYTF